MVTPRWFSFLKKCIMYHCMDCWNQFFRIYCVNSFPLWSVPIPIIIIYSPFWMWLFVGWNILESNNWTFIDLNCESFCAVLVLVWCIITNLWWVSCGFTYPLYVFLEAVKNIQTLLKVQLKYYIKPCNFVLYRTYNISKQSILTDPLLYI